MGFFAVVASPVGWFNHEFQTEKELSAISSSKAIGGLKSQTQFKREVGNELTPELPATPVALLHEAQFDGELVRVVPF